MARHNHTYTERCHHCSADWPDWAVQLAIQQEELIMGALSDITTAVTKAVDDAVARSQAHADDGKTEIAALQAEADAAVTALQAAEAKLAEISPAVAPAPEPAPAPAPAEQARSEYVVDPGTLVDAAEWPASGTILPDGRPTYFYAGDTAPGDAKGDGAGGVWHLATPVPAPTA